MEDSASVFGTVSTIATAVSAIAAMLAAFASFLAVRQTKITNQSQIARSLLKDYSDAEMLSHLRTLRKWESINGQDFARIWYEKLQERHPDAVSVDRSRRHVKNFFSEIAEFHENSLIDDRTFRMVGNRDGINILYDIVEPLEFALNSKFDNSKISYLRTHIGRVGTRGLMKPVG